MACYAQDACVGRQNFIFLGVHAGRQKTVGHTRRVFVNGQFHVCLVHVWSELRKLFTRHAVHGDQPVQRRRHADRRLRLPARVLQTGQLVRQPGKLVLT